MADPFILKEKYLPSQSSPRLIGGSMSGATLPLSNLPGAGSEIAGQEAQKALDRLWKLERGRVKTKNTLDAQTKSTEFGIKAAEKLQLLLTQDDFEIEDVYGTRKVDFREKATAVLNDERNSRLTGVAEVDNPYLEKTNFLNQRLQGEILLQSSKRLQLATGRAYAKNQNLKINQISEEQDIKLAGRSDVSFSVMEGPLGMERYFADFEADAALAIDDIEELKTWEQPEREELKLGTQERYSEEYINNLLRKNLWRSAEKFIENRLSTKDSLLDSIVNLSEAGIG